MFDFLGWFESHLSYFIYDIKSLWMKFMFDICVVLGWLECVFDFPVDGVFFIWEVGHSMTETMQLRT